MSIRCLTKSLERTRGNYLDIGTATNARVAGTAVRDNQTLTISNRKVRKPSKAGTYFGLSSQFYQRSNSISMRVLSFLTILLLAQGCQYDPYAHLYTTEKPQTADVAGLYMLASQTVTQGGLAAFQGKPCLIYLQADGTFTATNVPPWELGSTGTNFFSSLLTASGTWRIDSVGSIDNGNGSLKTHWGVYLDSPSAKIKPVGLTGQKPPYGLIFTLGDPDGGEAMILERAK